MGNSSSENSEGEGDGARQILWALLFLLFAGGIVAIIILLSRRTDTEKCSLDNPTRCSFSEFNSLCDPHVKPGQKATSQDCTNACHVLNNHIVDSVEFSKYGYCVYDSYEKRSPCNDGMNAPACGEFSQSYYYCANEKVGNDMCQQMCDDLFDRPRDEYCAASACQNYAVPGTCSPCFVGDPTMPSCWGSCQNLKHWHSVNGDEALDWVCANLKRCPGDETSTSYYCDNERDCTGFTEADIPPLC